MGTNQPSPGLAYLGSEPSGSTTLSELREPHKRDQHEHNTPPITLGLTIRRTRLITFTAIVVVLITGITVFFRYGVVIAHFDSRAKTTEQQGKLLDDYYSYSGNIASAFAKPIELFVTVAVQVIVLRFMADSFTRPMMSWKVSTAVLVVGAGVGYLISNGFNALNVQLRPEPIEPVIQPNDLGYYYDYSHLANGTVQDGLPISEARPGNLATNTLLAHTFLPKALRAKTICDPKATHGAPNGTTERTEAREAFASLGYLQRDYQGRMLTQALPANMLRVVVNPTNESLSEDTSAELPMETSLASTLFYHAITMGTDLFPWGERHAFANTSDIALRYPANGSNAVIFEAPTSVLYGLLPPEQDGKLVDERSQTAWFLRESKAAMARQFAFSPRTKQSDLLMEFSHTQITPNVAFDAVMFEVEQDPLLLATTATADNSTTYTVLDQLLNCPLPGMCMVEKTSYSAVDALYDPPAQVFALAMCTNKDGDEALQTQFIRQSELIMDDGLICGNTTTNSMLVVSVAKRLVADAIEQNVTASSNGTKVDNSSATLTNLRKVFSFTVGRLSWEFIDLAKAFNASCHPDEQSGCMGLTIPLSKPLDLYEQSEQTKEHVVVGAIELPTYDLHPPDEPLSLARTNLIVVDEPLQLPRASKTYKIVAGDVLLPHNVGNFVYNIDVDQEIPAGCSAAVEDRIRQVYGAHLFMEHGRQTTYTAATFMLFMFGTVKKELIISSTKQSLAFDGNIQIIAVRASTPEKNMWLTLSGCLVLVVGLLAALIKSAWFTSHNRDALASITEPQAIARVIIDERNYPPMFLHRRVIETQGTETVDKYAIAGLSLQQQQEQHEATKHTAATGGIV